MGYRGWAVLVLLGVLGMPLLPVSTGAARGLVSAGCKTEYFLLRELADAYQEKSGTSTRTAKTGNKQAVDLMLAGKVDFAFTCKSIGKLQKGLGLDPDAVSSWKSIPIAKDPIVVVVNRENGVNEIARDRLADIFRGSVASWRQLGGKDLPVRTAYLDPEVESGILTLFTELSDGTGGELDGKAKLLDAPSKLGNFVSATPGAVTFMGYNSYDEKYGDLVKIDGVAASRETILDGSYPLSVTYYLTIDQRGGQAVQDFVAYCQSPEGQAIINRHFIPYTE